MKILTLVLAIALLSGCATNQENTNTSEMVKRADGRHEVVNLGKYLRENSCRETFSRGQYRCKKNGQQFRAVHR